MRPNELVQPAPMDAYDHVAGDRFSTTRRGVIEPGAARGSGGHHCEMELRRVRLDDIEVRPLLDDLSLEYERRYGPGDEMAMAVTEEFDPPGGTFLVLLEDGVTVAGGGIRRWSEDTCEVKRLWTAPDHRRKGHASVVLRALEGAARDAGYAHVRAETGPAQPEALSFYRQLGYVEVPACGPYETDTAFQRTLLVDEDRREVDRWRAGPIPIPTARRASTGRR